MTNPNQNQDKNNSRVEGGPNDPNDINLDFDHGAETTTEMGEENQVTLVDPRAKCKFFFLAVIYLFWVVALVLTIAFIAESGGVDHSTAEAWNVVAAWYLAIFVWGWLLLNQLRILVIAALAPAQARTIFAAEQEERRKGGATGGGEAGRQERGFSFVTCALIPPMAVEIALDVLYVVDIKSRPEQYLTRGGGSVAVPSILAAKAPEKKAKEVEMVSVPEKPATATDKKGEVARGPPQAQRPLEGDDLVRRQAELLQGQEL